MSYCIQEVILWIKSATRHEDMEILLLAAVFKSSETILTSRLAVERHISLSSAF